MGEREPVRPAAHDVIGIDVAAAFRAAADHILATSRGQPTAWEAGCLYAALCELAMGREKNAQLRIGLALLPSAQQELPVSIIPLPTAEELLQALTLISTPNRASRLADHPDAFLQEGQRGPA